MSQADQEEQPSSSLGGRQARVLSYHLPLCAIRRRHGKDEIFWSYRVQLERGKQQRWTATFSRWAKCMSDEYFRIGKVSFTAASVGSVFLCSHSPGFEPAEFCIDEVDGFIYMVKLNQATSVITMFAQKLVIYEKLKLMQLVGVPVYFSSKPVDLCRVLKCSHFSISDDDGTERRFVLALSTCANSRDVMLHSDWLCLLSGLDAKNKSVDCTRIVRSMDSYCNVLDP